jgi:hypothetical protein
MIEAARMPMDPSRQVLTLEQAREKSADLTRRGVTVAIVSADVWVRGATGEDEPLYRLVLR